MEKYQIYESEESFIGKPGAVFGIEEINEKGDVLSVIYEPMLTLEQAKRAVQAEMDLDIKCEHDKEFSADLDAQAIFLEQAVFQD